jgi:hypothetical protein
VPRRCVQHPQRLQLHLVHRHPAKLPHPPCIEVSKPLGSTVERKEGQRPKGKVEARPPMELMKGGAMIIATADNTQLTSFRSPINNCRCAATILPFAPLELPEEEKWPYLLLF